MGLISRVSSRTYRNPDMEDLERAVDKALELALDLKKTTAENSYNGEGIYHVKTRALAKYEQCLLQVALAKSQKKSLGSIEETIYQSAVQRTILERIRPLELKLQPMIDKMLKIQADGLDEKDPLRFKPSMADMSDSSDGEEGN